MSAGLPMEMDTLYGDYTLDQAFDEMRERDGTLRSHYVPLAENLAHRLELIPLAVEPALLEYPDTDPSTSTQWTRDHRRCVKFELHVEGLRTNQPVYSGSFPLTHAHTHTQ